MSNCHICNQPGATETFKCKLDCDGEYQPICTSCEMVYRRFQAAVGEEVVKRLLCELQSRHDGGKKKNG